MSKFSVYQRGKKVSGQAAICLLESEEQVGIFESLRTYGGRIFREEEHLRRFQESMTGVGCRASIKISDLKKELRLAVNAFNGDPSPNPLPLGEGSIKKSPLHKGERAGVRGDLFLRLTLWKDQIFVFIGERKHPAHIYETGVHLKTSPVIRSHTNAQSPQVKTSAYHNAFMASLELKGEDIYEWIFLSSGGYVTEVRIGNLFMVKYKNRMSREAPRIITPPEDGILNGVTRGVVIKCALRNRVPFEETPLTRHDLYNADEVFLTNTSWEILPVASIDGRRIGEQIPGPVTRKLQTTFKQLIKEENKK